MLNVYCRGLLSDLKRKNCEPLALYAGVAVRTLQEFLRDHVWSFAQTRDLLQQHVAHHLPRWPTDDLGTLGIIDETGTVKKGTDTLERFRTHLDFIADKLGGKKVAELERLATAYFVTQQLASPATPEQRRTAHQ